MSCEYLVRFAPQSLADYVDEVVVLTQSAPDLRVRLLGAREPPRLTSELSQTLLAQHTSCGYILYSYLHGIWRHPAECSIGQNSHAMCTSTSRK